MSAEIINLRTYRKRKERADRATEASENRMLFGRTKAERDRQALEQARDKRTLDGAERSGPVSGPVPVPGPRLDGTKSDT